MSEIERDPVAVRVYERTLTEVAERQVIAEAEDALTRAWVGELETMRREGLRLAMTVRVATSLARLHLREAEAGGRASELARAHARLVATEADAAQGIGHARTLLDSVDAELEAVCQAALERTRRGERDVQRLRDAWTAAYGAP